MNRALCLVIIPAMVGCASNDPEPRPYRPFVTGDTLGGDAGGDTRAPADGDIDNGDGGDGGDVGSGGDGAPVCGNGVPETGESCDDGNTNPCDGCLADCTTHTNTCGDGWICDVEVCDPLHAAERCNGSCQPLAMIAAGNLHACATGADATIVCWGDNSFGQTDAPTSGVYRLVAAGFRKACALDYDGEPICWGSSPSSPNGTCSNLVCSGGPFDGEACAGDGACRAGPLVDIALGPGAGCGVREDGRVVCWGDPCPWHDDCDYSGDFVQIATDSWHFCGVLRDGGIKCWGAGAIQGTCDNPPYDCGQSMVPAGTYLRVAAGQQHTCAIRTDGTVACWGAGEAGGTGPFDYGQSVPPGGTFVEIAAGELFSCGIDTNREIQCWGRGDLSQTNPPSGTYRAIALGDDFGCAWRTDGTGMDCWGFNNVGQTDPP